MKWIIRQSIAAVLFFSLSAYANDPTSVPWPVGTDQGLTKTLLNSFGEPNTWDDGRFHAGIDIDSQTELGGDGDEIRCVLDNAVVSDIREVVVGLELQFVVVTTEGTGEFDHEDYGWWYEHLENPYVAPYGLSVWDTLDIGDDIGCMHPFVSTPHIHFMWSWWEWPLPVTDELWDWCYVNPLDYLDPEPEQGGNFDWIFNPNNNDPAFRSFFLEDMIPSSWPGSAGSVPGIMLDEYNLLEDVDLFFGFSLRGQGQSTTTGCGRDDLVPERIGWNLFRETTSGDELLEEKYIMNFDCPLSNDDSDAKVWQLYFRHELGAVFPDDEDGLIVCLTNCGEMEGWEGLGIENIEENCWDTNIDYLFSGDVINPVLAAYPDGPYRIDVTCYTHVNEVIPDPPTPDPAYSWEKSIECELHNFYPALREVSILDLVTDQTYYHGEWVPDGLSAGLDVSVDNPASAEAELQVVLVFTEEMNTGSLTATLGPVSVGNGVWSGSVVPNDTWTGEVTLPVDEGDGSYILSVSASDTDGMDLMDPEGAGTVPGPSYDTHHKLSLNFGTELEWTVPIHDYVNGSPALADLDGDGDLDVLIQSADGWVDVLDDDGSSMPGWPVNGGWSSGDPEVHASPAIVNLAGVASSLPEILAVHPRGCNGLTSAGSAISPWSGILSSMWKWHINCSPLAGDFNGDGVNEYAIGRQVVENVVNGVTFLARENDGSPFWLTAWGEDESVSATPSLCDVDGDDDLEILVVTDWTQYPADSYGTLYCLNAATGTEEWSTSVGGTYILCAVATGNLDVDDALEIVVGASSGSSLIKVLNGSDGNIQYSIAIAGDVSSGASIADVDGDGDNDIVISSSGGILYCWDGPTGIDLPGFPVNLNTWSDDGVSIGDIDSDGMLELVLAGKDGKLYVINHDGSTTAGFPVTVSTINALSGQPALGDIDGDGRLEILFGEMNSSVLHCYEMADNSAYTYLPWPQFQHDSRHTGCFESDNTIPEPPTNLTGEITYNGGSCEVELEWNLSVNDPYSGSPEEPTDVICYAIYRVFAPNSEMAPEVVGLTSAGDSTYVDYFSNSFNNPIVVYWATSRDGTNESEYSNYVKFPTSPSDVISLGCSVVEKFSVERASIRIPERTEIRTIEESSRAEITSEHERTAETLPTLSDCAVPSRGNPGCLTDGSSEVCYSPSPGADAVVIDLGDECTVTSIIPERMPDISASVVEPSLLFEVAGSDREFYPFLADYRNSTENVRYIRVSGASGLTQISVYGSRGILDRVSSVEITRSAENEGWMFAIPVAERCEEAEIKIYDISGRMIWSGHAESGSVLHWDGFTGNGTDVPNGVYLLHCSIGSEISTGSFVVRRE